MRISDWSSDVCSSDLTWPDGKRSVYQGKEPGDRHSAVRITDKRTSWAILRNPSLGAGEAFMDGRIVIEDGDIRQLLGLIIFNTRWPRGRSAERRVGQECVRPCRSRGSPHH